MLWVIHFLGGRGMNEEKITIRRERVIDSDGCQIETNGG